MRDKKIDSLTTMETALSSFREWRKSEDEILRILSNRSWIILNVAAKVYGVHPLSIRLGKETSTYVQRVNREVVDDVLGKYAFASISGRMKVVDVSVGSVTFSSIGTGKMFRVPTSILLEENDRVLASAVRKETWRLKKAATSKRERERAKLEEKEHELEQRLAEVRAKKDSL